MVSSIYLKQAIISQPKSHLLFNMYVLFFLLFASSILAAKAQPVDEEKLRTAVVLGIMRYTTWQQAPEKHINVCIVGKSKSTQHLLALDPTLRVHQKSIFVSRYDDQSKTVCQVLLLGAKNKHPLSTLISADSTLVICDGCTLNKKKSAVLMRKYGDKIRFDVNTNIAEKYNVKFSSSMLELASKVN